MKKTVITVVAVAVAAVAAHAQNSADARFTADCLRSWANQKQAKTQRVNSKPANSATAANYQWMPIDVTDGQEFSWSRFVAQAQPEGDTFGGQGPVLPQGTAAQVKAEQAVGDVLDATIEQATFEAAQRHFAHRPATGAFADYVDFGRLEEAKPAQPERTARVEISKATAHDSGNWFTRLMGFEKYEGETDDEWQSRLYYMSIK